jgi:hypothetical protein
VYVCVKQSENILFRTKYKPRQAELDNANNSGANRGSGCIFTQSHNTKNNHKATNLQDHSGGGFKLHTQLAHRVVGAQDELESNVQKRVIMLKLPSPIPSAVSPGSI